MAVSSYIVPAITLGGPVTAATGSAVTIPATVTGAGSSYTIHWRNHGVEFATTTVPSVTYTKTNSTDNITARVVSTSAGCYDSTTSAEHVVTTDHTGVAINIPGEVSIYPNPAHDEIIITSQHRITTIVIANLLGQTLYNQRYNSAQVNVRVADLPAGVYVVKINGTEVRRFVKQ
jgi:hypothetical protein